MQSNDSRPVKTSGQRRSTRTEPRDFVRNAADQFRKARENTDDDWEDAALRALEGECYRLLTGGFRRASELVDRGDGIETDGGTDRCTGDTERFDILHLFADTGVEDEVLHTFGDVLRVGIDPEPNPFSTAVKGDACDPPVGGSFDLAVAHPPCQRWSVATPGGGADPEDHPDHIDEARRVCRDFADHYIIENVRDAPLRDPIHLTGGMFGLAIHYPRAFETSFPVRQPQNASRWRPEHGPLAEQGKHGNAWVGTNAGWRLAKGYGYDWPGRGLKRHAVPAPYLRRLLYWWLAAVDGDSPPEQATINALADGGTSVPEDTDTDRSEGGGR